MKLDIIWQLLCKTVVSSKFVQVVVNPDQSQQLLQAKIVGFVENHQEMVSGNHYSKCGHLRVV